MSDEYFCAMEGETKLVPMEPLRRKFLLSNLIESFGSKLEKLSSFSYLPAKSIFMLSR